MREKYTFIIKIFTQKFYLYMFCKMFVYKYLFVDKYECSIQKYVFPKI